MYRLCSGLLLTLVCLVAPSFAHDVNEGENFLQDSDVVQDQNHIQEHLQGRVDIDFSQLTPKELEFYYFHLHDLDGSQTLDGLELITALEHSMYKKLVPQDPDVTKDSEEEIAKRVAKYVEDTVDDVLEEVDQDKDGYLTYAEFKMVKRHAHIMTWSAKAWAQN